MSLSSSYKTEIVIPKPQLQAFAGNIKGTPCMEIMQLALAKIAKERNGRVTDGYQDCVGKQHKCVMGIATPAMPNGIGVEVGQDGRVSFPYDQKGADTREVQAICNDIARAYATIAVMRIRNQHGYRVGVESEKSTPAGRRVATIAVRS